MLAEELLVTTCFVPGTYLVHKRGQIPVEGVSVHYYDSNNAWVCEEHGANHATTRLDCEHIRAVRGIFN